MFWFFEPVTFQLMISDLVAYGEAPHYLIDLDLDLVADLSICDEDHKTLDPGNAIALTSDVLDLDVVLFSDLDRGRLANRGLAFFTHEQNLHLPCRPLQTLWPMAKRRITLSIWILTWSPT